ncbi:neuronal membrane glycoprotein M6-b-like [Saccoglossus kowalevskii]|uniref:Neuronal membrane glycoprotein M6-a-like n=1 Tax=Saccoglossus kowalevskii TaxID=10224 RepID=A0ABM0M9E6_SACKO|nr:PREDICTED: neuronal membrane glycoprotein M6-a-like [Saccoglossus kowalevskii]
MGCCDTGCCACTPWGSIVAFFVLISGLCVFCYFSIHAIIATLELFTGTEVENNEDYTDGIAGVKYAIYAIVGVIAVIGTIVLILGAIATCTTAKKSCKFGARCAGRLCIVIFEVVVYILCVCWILIFSVLVAPVVFGLMVTVFCNVDPVEQLTTNCLDLSSFGIVSRIAERVNGTTEICFDELAKFCDQTDVVFFNYLLTFIGCLIIIIGFIHFLMCLSANYAHLSHGRSSSTKYKQKQEIVDEENRYQMKTFSHDITEGDRGDIPPPPTVTPTPPPSEYNNAASTRDSYDLKQRYF